MPAQIDSFLSQLLLSSAMTNELSLVQDTKRYLDSVEPEALRKELLAKATRIYNFSTFNRWNKAGGVRRLSVAEFGALAERIEFMRTRKSVILPGEQAVPNSSDLSALLDLYAINEIWHVGDELSTMSNILLSDKYLDKARAMLGLIVPDAAKDQQDSFLVYLSDLLAPWTFGESRTVGGDSRGFSEYRTKHYAGMLLLELGAQEYHTIRAASARLNKCATDEQQAAIFNGSSMAVQ